MNAITIKAVDTLGATKVYKVLEGGVVMGTVTKTIDHRVNARDQRVAFAVWSFACPVGHCDGYATRAEAIVGMMELFDIECETMYEDDVVIRAKDVDVKEFNAITGKKPLGVNRWAFKIVGTAGAMIRMVAGESTYNPAAFEIAAWAKANAALIREQVGALRAIVLAV